MIKDQPAPLELCCPACGGAVARQDQAYLCQACGRAFPILFGVADFRLGPDPYLSLEEEREKAGRLDQFAQTHSFSELLDYYYSITDDVPPDLARAYARYVLAGPGRAERIIQDLSPFGEAGRMLDLGCGGGGLIIAARRAGIECVGADIALRWLVICRKRLAELGLETLLICAQAEHLPFPAASFTAVAAVDLLENCADPQPVIKAVARQLAPGGRLWLSSNNSWWPGPHLASGVWAARLMPATLRSLVLKTTRGVDSLRHIRLVSSCEVSRLCAQTGLAVLNRRPLRIDAASAPRRGLAGLCARLYAGLSQSPATRFFLYAFGPAFELQAVARHDGSLPG